MPPPDPNAIKTRTFYYQSSPCGGMTNPIQLEHGMQGIGSGNNPEIPSNESRLQRWYFLKN